VFTSSQPSAFRALEIRANDQVMLAVDQDGVIHYGPGFTEENLSPLLRQPDGSLQPIISLCLELCRLRRRARAHGVVHPKRGGRYDVLCPGPHGAAIDCTNGPAEGRRLTVYRAVSDGQLYVREESQFHEPGRFVHDEATT